MIKPIKFSEAIRAYKKFPEEMISDTVCVSEAQGTLVAVDKAKKLPPWILDRDKGEWVKMEVPCRQSA